MDHFTSDTELIVKYIKEFKLPTVKDSLDDIESDALAQNWDYRRFLRTLLQREVEQCFENRKYIGIKRANFPQMKYLQKLVREDCRPKDRISSLNSKLSTSSVRGAI